MIKHCMRNIQELIIHCSATKANQDVGVSEIRDWHVNGNGWSDIGYHYVIRRSGALEQGRSENVKGAHAKGHNKNTIGICLVGGIGDNQQADANFTFAQYQTLVSLIQDLKDRYGMNLKVSGHRDYANKACPCFSVQNLIEYT